MVVPKTELSKIEEVILRQTQNYKFGKSEDPDADISTLASKEQYDRVKSYIELGIAEGARMLLGEILRDCESEDEAVNIANDSIYGLTGAVSGPRNKANDVAHRMRMCTVYIYDGQWDVPSPFGGYKQSGLVREGGVEGYEEFLKIKTICIND